ncbi:aminotransferase class I/II-fold pyridoxal phosphate-dependent enzyme [Pseudogracilibacillus auburnensis]|uniref:Aminotransferase n=1 Tax=Pseudogracilibacillus auburnensis TaxID=1494959 RepID=A0A2V3VLD9_9BACI|nr:aminotransferase class I/II-fold pyridoxal phosphate-dependent enzyme [Pseudogracilibacillus auburnensis]PXW81701.1 aminotransferase [Pseudogracilibacillus auburnensis]
MLKKINSRVKGIEVPSIRVFSNQVVQFDDGINLTIGEPDFPTPEKVKQAGMKAINNNLTGYSHNAGLFELRKSVSRFFEEKYGFYYNPENEIVITTGASEGIDSVLRTILQEGDEVILPAPIYSGYEPIIHLNGAKVVYLDTSETDFIPDPHRLDKLMTEKTKAIILNYPSNPTGVTIGKEVMDRLVHIFKKHSIFVLTDEIYSENTFNEKHLSFAAYPELRDQLFLLHGLSKSHAMTGWRVGFVLGPNNIMQHVLKVHLYNSICASLPSQYAAIEALTSNRDTPATMNQAYIERRNFVQKRLQLMGLKVIQPTGAFYIFPSIKKTELTSLEFATRLLHEGHVAVVPGSGFTSFGEGYLRISYANSMKNLELGMDRLENFIHNLS